MLKTTKMLLALCLVLSAAACGTDKTFVSPDELEVVKECRLDGVVAYASLGEGYDVEYEQLPLPNEGCMQLAQKSATRQALIDTMELVDILRTQLEFVKSSTLRFEANFLDCGELAKEEYEFDISGWVTFSSFHRLSHNVYSTPWSKFPTKVSRDGILTIECKYDEQYKFTVGYNF